MSVHRCVTVQCPDQEPTRHTPTEPDISRSTRNDLAVFPITFTFCLISWLLVNFAYFDLKLLNTIYVIYSLLKLFVTNLICYICILELFKSCTLEIFWKFRKILSLCCRPRIVPRWDGSHLDQHLSPTCLCALLTWGSDD